MASQRPGPGRASGADAKEAKAKKWAAFRAQNYDGEGWGDDYGGNPSPPRQQRGKPSSPPTNIAASHSIQPKAPLPSPPQFTNGSSAASLPSQAPGPQTNTEFGRGPARSGSPRNNLKRESLVGSSQSTGGPGVRSGHQQQVEQRPTSPLSRGSATPSPQPARPADPYRRMGGAKLPDTPELGRSGNAGNPTSPATLQSPRPASKDETSSQGPGQALNTKDPRTLTNAPTTTLADPGNSHPDPDKRFSRSPRLPDLARMSMFGDDFFTTSLLDEDPPPPMPSLPSPSAFSIGEPVVRPGATAANVSSPGPTVVQSQPQRAASGLASPPLAERSMRISSGDIAAPSTQVTAQSDLSATEDRSQRSGASSLVSGAARTTPESSRLSSTLNPNGMAGQIPSGSARESASNASSLHEDRFSEQFARDLSPSPLRSMSPAVNPAEPVVPSGNRSVQNGTPVNIPPGSPDTKSPVETNDDEPASGSHPQRQSTMDTTASTIPKESDMLREEIIQSLASPTASDETASHLRTQHQRDSTLDSDIRESTYLPSVYDDYWATTADDQSDTLVPRVPPLHTDSTEGMPIAPLRPRSKSPNNVAMIAPYQPLRQRFSWEGGQVRSAVSPSSAQAQRSEAPTAPPAGAASARMLEAGSPKPEEEKATGEQDSRQGPSGVSRQGSHVSKGTAVDDDAVSSDPKRLSLAAEKDNMEGSTEHLETGPAEDHPALRESHKATSSRPSSKTLTFREIMALGTYDERIHKFDETRSQFAAMDQGLGNWIAGLKSQPEHHCVSAVYTTTGVSLPTSTSPAAQRLHSPTSAGPGQAQQPYHQQYLSASTAHPGAHGPPNMMGPGPSTPGSAFKHSSNQAGVKSKELLLAAGKAGKGLLSKGKNKLRGSTGDKNDSSPPYAPPNPQSDRRQSFGATFGFGARCKSDTPSPGQLQQPTPGDPNAAPRPQAAHRLLNGAGPALQPPPAGVLSAYEEPVSPVSEAHSRVSSIDGDDVFAPQGSRAPTTPLADVTQRWAPATTSPLAEKAPRVTAGEAVPGGDAGAAREVEGDDNSEDWTGVSPGQHPHRRVTGAPETSEHHRALGQDGRIPGSEDAGHGETVPPHSLLPRFSFDGLPSIRRGSIFDFTPEEDSKGLADDAASVDEGSDGGSSGAKLSREPRAESPPTTSDPHPAREAPLEEPFDGTCFGGQTLGNDYATTEDRLVDLAKQKSLLTVNPAQHPAVAGSPPRTGDESTAPSISHNDEPQAPVIAVDPSSAHVPPGGQQPAPPSTDGQQSTLAHAGPSIARNLPPHMTLNPIQRPPPGGQWNLQESYLSEPLISPSRKRSTSAGSQTSQTPPFAGYDKETGEGAPEAPAADSSDEESVAGETSKEGSSRGRRDSEVEGVREQEPPRLDARAGERPTAERGQPFLGAPQNMNMVRQSVTPRPRPPQKYGDTPPVSIQRYRGLFAPKEQQHQQQPQAYGLPGRQPPPQSQPARAEPNGILPADADAARPAPLSSRPPTADSRDRRPPGIFNQISDRLTKMGSQGGPDGSAEAAGDGASEASVPTVDPRHKRRSSFFLSLKGPSAADAGPRSGESVAANAPSTLGDRDQATAEPEEAPRRSFFGVGKARASTAGPLSLSLTSSSSPSRFIPGLSRASAPENDAAREQGQGKSRFGGLGKFWRSGGGQDGASLPDKPGSSGSSVRSAHSKTQPPPPQASGDHVSLIPPRVRGRSGTTGSMPGSPGPSPLARANAAPGGQGRRVSGPGVFMSNVWNARSPSGSEERVVPGGRDGEMPLRMPQHGPQYGPAGSGAPLGARQLPQGHQVPRAPGAAVPGGPTQPAPRFGPSQRQGQGPPGHAQHGSIQQRQTSAPCPAGPPPGHGTAGAGPPTHQRQISVPEAPSPTHQQDWRPVPMQQAVEPEAAGSPGRQHAPQDSNQGRTSRGSVPEDGPAESEVPDKTDAFPIISATTSPDPDRMGRATAPERETTPRGESPPSADQMAQGDGDAVPRVTPRTDEPPLTAGPPAFLPASPALQQARIPDQQRASNSPHRDGTPVSGSESARPDPGQSEGAGSSGAPTPQASSPAPTPVARMVSPSQSIGQTAGLDGAPLLRQALPQGHAPAGQVPGQLPQGLRPAPIPQGLRPAPIPQGPPGPLPGQLPQSQIPHGQPPPPGALQGQWRQFVPVPGQQMPMPPGQLQGAPAPWGPNPNGTGALHGNSPAQFHAAVTPPPGQQPQRPEQQGQGQGGVSKWLKGISSGQQPAQQQQQQQQATVQIRTEKSGKSLFSAFKRSSKLPEARPSPAAQQQPVFAGGQGQHAGLAPGGYPQQYGHPQFAADPRRAVAGSPYPQQMGQYGPGMPQGQRQFVQAPFPGAPQPMQGQVPYAPGQSGQFQTLGPNHVQQQDPSTAPSMHTSVASGHQPWMNVAGASAALPVGQGPPPGSPAMAGALPPATATATYQPTEQRGTPEQGLPPTVPRIGVSTEPCATSDADKPLPAQDLLEAQRSTSDVSQVSNVPSSDPPPPEGGSKTVATLEEAVRRRRRPEGDGAREGGKLTLDVEAARRRSDETDLYDATPRVGPPATTREGTPASGGGRTTPGSTKSDLVLTAEPGSGRVASPPAASRDDPATAPSRAATDESPATTPTTESSTRSTEPPTQSTEPPTESTGPPTQPTDQTTQGTQTADGAPAKPGPVVESKQQELIRKMRLEAQEEKILVPGQEGLPGGDQEDDDDRPKMSATSYPGQEWNPYGGYDFYHRE